MEVISGRTVLIDTNLLLLLLMGLIDQRLITSNKRTRKYSAAQFESLYRILRGARLLVTTEHVNAQTSDLGAASLSGRYREQFLMLLRSLHDANAAGLLRARETSHPIMSLEIGTLSTLGVADAGIIKAAAENDCVLMTDDFDLYMGALRRNVEAVNFSHDF